MIVSASTEEGRKAKVFLKDGTYCTLPIKSYDTETQIAIHFELDEDGKVKLTDWFFDGKKSVREPILTSVKLEGSYVEIDGKRV